MALVVAAAGAGVVGVVVVPGEVPVDVPGDVPVEVPGLAAALVDGESPPPPPPQPASVMTRQANGTAAILMWAFFMGSPCSDSAVVKVDGCEGAIDEPNLGGGNGMENRLEG
ncbi:hypothetical protein [Cupriavidus nantongensis]|uniref:hypothetical protein n=1 Tax=Cupriavidus nantongensis TaxID=1796606 RepID=UPI000ABC3415|nr:hypothetical protein [Cupriavidus nantongensis]